MGQEEKERVVGSDQQDQETKLLEVVAEEEEEESKETMRGGGGDAADCDNCGGAAAAVYCRADTARLCLTCDRDVHGANAVCSRHARAPLCGACRGAGAVFRRHAAGAGAGGFLCSNCDFARHRHGEVPPHDRCTVQGYTGCPSAHELAALLGLADFEKPAAAAGAHEGGGWWDIWEEPHVFSLEDLIVPTTSCHDFQPLLTPSSPKRKNQSSMDGKTNVEIIAQLGEIAKLDGGTENGAYDQEAEQGAGDQLLSWAPSQFITGHGNFGTENNNEVGIMPTPGYENGGWDNSDYHVLNDQCKVEFTYEQAPVSSGEACMSSFVHMSEICPGMSNGSSMEDNAHTDPGIGVPMQVLPKRAGPEYVTCADRSSVITRYKEKRKTRRFDKQVRYESRKARADSRLRVKGRFAKANQN